MKQWWWVAGVGAVGIVLAILLFPRPDTGADIPDADPTNTDPGNFKQAPAGAAPTRRAGPSTGVREGAPTERPTPGEPFVPPPELVEQRAWRGRPAAAYASRVLSPFSAIRYVLMKEGSADARALADELGTGVMQDLRAVRSSKEDDPLTPLEPKLDEAAGKVAASPWAADETIRKSLEKYKEQIAEFEEVKKTGVMPEPPPKPTTPVGDP